MKFQGTTDELKEILLTLLWLNRPAEERDTDWRERAQKAESDLRAANNLAEILHLEREDAWTSSESETQRAQIAEERVKELEAQLEDARMLATTAQGLREDAEQRSERAERQADNALARCLELERRAADSMVEANAAKLEAERAKNALEEKVHYWYQQWNELSNNLIQHRLDISQQYESHIKKLEADKRRLDWLYTRLEEKPAPGVQGMPPRINLTGYNCTGDWRKDIDAAMQQEQESDHDGPRD